MYRPIGLSSEELLSSNGFELSTRKTTSRFCIPEKISSVRHSRFPSDLLVVSIFFARICGLGQFFLRHGHSSILTNSGTHGLPEVSS